MKKEFGFDIDGYLKAKITSLFDKMSKKEDVIKQLIFMKFANDNMAKSREEFEHTELYKKYSELFNSFNTKRYEVDYLATMIDDLAKLGSISHSFDLKEILTEWVELYKTKVKRTVHVSLVSKIRRNDKENRVKILSELNKSDEDSHIRVLLSIADSLGLEFDAAMYALSKSVHKNELGSNFLKNYIGDSEIEEGSFLYRLNKLKEYISANFSKEEADLFDI